jgi:hypothetical protein
LTTRGEPLDALEPLIGEWSLVAVFKDLQPMDAGARVTFDWLPGRTFLSERWEVPVPEAPDGIAIIGADPASEGDYLQHYFDSRGVARVYKMSLANRGVEAVARRAGLLAPRLRAALHRNLQRRWQDHRRPLGNQPR